MTTITAYASRYGGEHTIGTITQEQGHFWHQMGHELFTQYLHFQWAGDAKHDLNITWNIPEHLQLKEFWEIDDIDHQNAPLFYDGNMIEFAKVLDDGVAHIDDEETVAELDFASDEVKKMVLIADEETVNYKGDDVIVYSWSAVKGGFETAFEIEGDFDITKLKLLCSTHQDDLLVTGFGYDGEELDHNGWQDNSHGKGQSSWIDEDTLKMNHKEWCDANPELMKLISEIHLKEKLTELEDETVAEIQDLIA